jgi:hypothetical protein
MPLSKKDYVKIADALCSTYKSLPKAKECHQCVKEMNRLTEELTFYFKNNNPLFDKSRFLKAVHAEKCKWEA